MQEPKKKTIEKSTRKRIRAVAGKKKDAFPKPKKAVARVTYKGGSKYYKPTKFDIGFIVRKNNDKPAFVNPKILSVAKRVFKKKTVYSWQTSKVVVFTVSVLIISLFLQGAVYLSSAKDASGEILGVATSAYEDLNLANQSLGDQNFESALQLFSSAQSNLEIAQGKLDEYKTLTLINSQAKSADNILSGAYLLSQAGAKLTQALQLFDEVAISDQGIQTENFNKRLRQNKLLLKDSLGLLKQAQDNFDKSTNLPANYFETLEEAKRQVGELSGLLQGLVTLEDLYLAFFDGAPKTYLLVFQNYDEARATGGFIGTYGVLKIDQGKIQKLSIQSVYEFDGSFLDKTAAPGPFQPEIQKWGLRDANWFVDFRQSSQKLLEFYEKGKETVDGVVAFTPKIFSDLLRIVGPIHMEQHDAVLTPYNFQDVVQRKTSIEYDLELNQPKKFLADFALIMLNRLNNLDKEQWFSFFQVLQSNLLEKHILLYSKETETQSQIENLGFGGRVLAAEKDYLSLVNSNLGGTKTDLDIVQKVDLKTRILSDGTVINSLQIERQNTASEGNRNYMRVLVPKGSKLISASGLILDPHFASISQGFKTDLDLASWDRGELQFDKVFVREEAGKTEFAGWSETNPDEISQINFTYSLPFKVNPTFLNRTAIYSMVFQKQLGSLPLSFDQRLEFEGLKQVWLTTNATSEDNQANFNFKSTRDGYWAVVFLKD
ncbi:MAG: DUF4012 domain-containing protein [bacterium]|nr:DUF4012 domain-containing protein [bacterium]